MEPKRILCPRRGGPGFILPDEDAIDPRDCTCTYCGSLDPDVLMARLEVGDVELIPTDKSYKAYARNRGGQPFLQTYRIDSRPYQGHFSAEHDWVTRETSQTKFYFQHLSAEQRRRFIELHNGGKLHLGAPGRFYVVPFFCRVGE